MNPEGCKLNIRTMPQWLPVRNSLHCGDCAQARTMNQIAMTVVIICINHKTRGLDRALRRETL
jgi:hypothetical protein